MQFENHILFEDYYLLVVDKPKGLQVENDKLGHPSLQAYAQEYLNRKYNKEHYLGIVHRLDRPTGGVIVLAKTKGALSGIQKQIEEKNWKKQYNCWVEGSVIPKSGTLKNWLLKDAKSKLARVVSKDVPNAKLATMHYRVVKVENNFSLLEVELVTGRYHQIRAQLGYLSYPIKGDQQYGASQALVEGIDLIASKLSFNHPKTGNRMEFSSNQFVSS